jgi:DNA polymerase-3 subunit delta'
MRLSNIIGHDTLRPKLSQFVGVSQAYLFYGPPSIGKRTVARELSRYFLCQGTKEDGCSCKSCMCFQDHPDLLCIGRDGILVKDIDGIIGFVLRAPLCSGTKVIIIDNVDQASYGAANRLLKTIEESTIPFFLITSKLNQVLPTIQSRCLKIPFNSLSPDDVANILWKRMGYDLPQARILGWIGSGSSIDIFSNAGLYLKYRDMSFDFLNLFSASDFLNVLDFLDKIPKNELIIFIDMIMMTLTDVLLLVYSVEAITNSDRRSDVQKLAKNNKQQNLIIALNLLSQVKKNSYLNVNLGLAFKSTLIKIWSIMKA